MGNSVTAWELIALFFLIPGLIGLNGFFVAVEFGLVAARKTRMESLAEHGDIRAKIVYQLQNNLDQAVAATQLGITFASISLGSVGEVTLASILQRVADPAFDGLVGAIAVHSICSTLAVAAVSYLHLIFGELIPKTIAIQNPDQVVLYLAHPMDWFYFFARPFVLWMNHTGNFVLKVIGFKNPGAHAHAHSVEELLMIVEDTEEAGVIQADQADVLENVFRLSGKTVAHIMVPQSEINALELSLPAGSILDLLRDRAHTRLPVYDGSIDNIVGIVNVKDLLFLFSLHGLVILEDALYPALFILPNETAMNAMKLFRKTRRHMAIVQSEEGKVVGLLTLEDVLEEIVGEIQDEHDAGSAFHSPGEKQGPRMPGQLPGFVSGQQRGDSKKRKSGPAKPPQENPPNKPH